MPSVAGRLQLVRILAVATCYFALGTLALKLAVPPGFSAPIYPAAGVALAVTLVYGPWMALGAFFGGLGVNIVLSVQLGMPSLQAIWAPIAVGLGAAAQALLGAALVRWQLHGHAGGQMRDLGPADERLTLSEPTEVVRFFVWGGAVACLLNATWSNWVLSFLGLLAAPERAFTWWSWWSGDTLGVLIAAPITLTLIARPRGDWAPRRISVAMPLLGATVLLALMTALVTRWQDHRAHAAFERDATAAAEALNSRLNAALFALEATRGLFVAHEAVAAEELRRAVTPWFLRNPQIVALGYAERTTRSRVASFEQRVRQLDGRPDYHVIDHPSISVAAGPGGDVDVDLLPIRMVEPLAGNASVLGVNVLSATPPRQAVLLATAGETEVATSGFKLAQEVADQAGVVVYRALYRGNAAAANRADNWTGVVFVALRMQQTAEAAMADAPAYLRWCLVDLEPNVERPRLAGPTGCEQAPLRALALAQNHDLRFAGRHWRLIVGADQTTVPDSANNSAWLFSSVGLASTALLAALLLTVTGRARRIESAVTERTADLRREVAERQRTEAALRESEQRFRNIFDQAPLGIAYADLRGHVSESNPRLRALLGYDGDALSRQALTDLALPQDRADETDALQRLLRGELTTVSRRLRLQHSLGQWLWVQMNWSVLRDTQGQPQRLVAVVEDVTDQLMREEAEQGRQVAESANRAKNEFLSRMSHELRTPLNAMLGFAQLLQLDRKPALAAHQAGWNNHILHAGWHLLEMINDILDLSRIEAGMLRLDPAPVPLAPLLDHCLAMVAQAAAKHGIHIDLMLAPDASTVLGDETRLKQVLTNLLSNAVKYNVEGGRVRISSQCIDGGRVALSVADTGPGLTPGQLAELFQPFNRLGREQGDVEGTGIGLVISRRLAEWMGGSLEVSSTAGAGATFVLTLPLGVRDPTPDRAAHGTADPSQYRLRHVLYVEDNETNAEVMRGILAQRPQVSLRVATTGRDGLRQMRQHRPDLVLMDMHLPDIDGLALLREMRLDRKLRTVPVLVVSADATPTRVDDALASGALHYLTKPLNVGTFLSTIDEALKNIDTGFGELSSQSVY